MALNSQEKVSFTLQRSSAESDESDPDFDASPESSDHAESDLFDSYKSLYSNPTAFQDPILVPAAIQKISKDDSIWEYLNKGRYNLVARSQSVVPYPTEHSAQTVVKKMTYPSKDIYK